MSLKRQITLVLIIIGALMLVLLAESIFLLNRIGSGIEQRELNDEPYEAALIFRYHVAQVQQFATDASAVGDPESLKESTVHFGLANQQLDAISKSLPDQSSLVATIRTNLDNFHATGIRMANTYIEQGQEAGNTVMKEPNTGFDDQGKALTGSFDNLFSQLEKTNAQLKLQLGETEHDGRVFLTASHIALFLAVMAVLILGSRRIMQLLGCEPEVAAKAAKRIADGDLTSSIDCAPAAESLMGAMSQMRSSLQDTVRAIRNSANSVLQSSQRLNQEATQVVNSSRKQSDAAASMSASTEEMNASIAQMADFSHNVSLHAGEAGSTAQESGQEVHAVTEEIGLVAESVHQASRVISALGEESKQITAIVDTIRDIADQTNLLALNAAIEAARAGEQGRGFAVVADEVRKLAERTTTSTREISGMVDAINIRAAEAVRSMEESLALVAKGVDQAEHAYHAMADVGTNTEKVVAEINEINSTLQEQRKASTQIAQHVEHIAQMAERNVDSISEIASHAGNLENLAKNLESQIQHFRV